MFARFVGGLTGFFLDLAGMLFEFSAHFTRVVAGYFSGRFFHTTFDFVLGTFNTIFVHLLLRAVDSGDIMRIAVEWLGANRVKKTAILLSVP